MNEGEAISRLKQGDISGLETLVHRYQVQAVRTAYLVTRDRHLAEDATRMRLAVERGDLEEMERLVKVKDPR